MATYGIDLGTTYSCITKFEGGQPIVIKNELDENSTASAVYFGGDGSVLVGDEAKGYVQTEGYRVVQFVKREIGKTSVPHEIDGKEYNAIEISALILKKMAKYAQDQGEIVKDVVITCPAYFGNEERDATKKAGILAGFNVLEIINEPTAAAISYAFANKGLKDEVVVVYDLGGGTFDVTVLDIKIKSNGVPSCTVLASDGDDQLGGKDWDEILYSILERKIVEENGLDGLDAEGQFAIRSIVEKTKKSLSTRESLNVNVVINGERMSCEVTRDEFEQATAHLVQKTTDCLDRVLNLPNVKSHKVDKILLVGGSSNMPVISRTIKAKYGDAGAMNDVVAGLSDGFYTETIPVVFSDPETAVAKGASIYANMLKKAETSGAAGLSETIEIHDIASRTFGIDIYYGNDLVIDNLVFKGAEIPCSVTDTYNPMEDNQSGVQFYIYESTTTEKRIPVDIDFQTGEIKNPDPRYGLKLLGNLVLPFPPNVKRETDLIVTMTARASGIHVKCKNTLNNDEVEVEIEFSNNQVDLDNNQIDALEIE